MGRMQIAKRRRGAHVHMHHLHNCCTAEAAKVTKCVTVVLKGLSGSPAGRASQDHPGAPEVSNFF